MKKCLQRLLLLLLCGVLLFSGCSAGKADNGRPEESYDQETNAAAPSAAPGMGEASDTLTNEGGVAGLLEYPAEAEDGEKIIYSALAQLETLEFETSVQAVYDMIDRYEGFLERADVSGTDYSSQFYGYKNYRQANFTIRVPKEHFAQMMNSLGEIGNVIYSSTQAENITSQFTDTQSRLDMYRTEEDRLLTMLESAATVEDMILIESRLSEVRYSIESLTSQLNNWQKQVDYSTLDLTLNEVEALTEEIPVQRSYWEQVGDSLRSVLQGMGSFFKDFLRILIAALPVLALCAALTGIVLGILFTVRRRLKKHRGKKEEEQEENKD